MWLARQQEKPYISSFRFKFNCIFLGKFTKSQEKKVFCCFEVILQKSAKKFNEKQRDERAYSKSMLILIRKQNSTPTPR